MRQSQPHPTQRWCERPPGGEAPEDRAAALIRRALWACDADEREIARIEQRILSQDRRGHHPRLIPRLGVVARLGAVASVLLLGAAGVCAYQFARRAGWFGVRWARGPVEAPASRHTGYATIGGRTDTTGESTAAPAAAPESSPLPARSPTGTDHERAKPSTSHRPPASAQPAVASASEEILAFDQAIRLLRHQHDARAALKALDAYLSRFPAGLFEQEARFARVDAMLMLGRSDQALLALEQLPFDGRRRSIELRLIRGELRSPSQCVRAEDDFSAVLDRSKDAAFLERALYGRAACRVRRGDRDAALRDLQSYLDRFPSGTHAGWASRWLESLAGSATNGGKVRPGSGR